MLRPSSLGLPSLPFNPAQVEWFYFTSYLKHWSQPKFSDALACMPQVWLRAHSPTHT